MIMNKDELKDAGEYVNGFLLEDDSPYKLELIECPICGKTLFNDTATYEECEVCGWYNDEDAEEIIAAKKNESENAYLKDRYTEMVYNYRNYGDVNGKRYGEFKREVYIRAFGTLHAYEKRKVLRYLKKNEEDIRYAYDKAKEDARKCGSSLPFAREIGSLDNSFFYDYRAEDDV